MVCFFCGDPAAHPATGCQYSERVLACYACVVRFWAWVRQHMRARRGVDFYAAATRWTTLEGGK